jgi:hypothetical protein
MAGGAMCEARLLLALYFRARSVRATHLLDDVPLNYDSSTIET